MSYLSLEKLSKAYAGKNVLHDISLSFSQGEFVSILGPSGCGKTTLLHLLAGISQPDSGALFLQETDITHLPAEERNFGMVFQNHALFPHLSVEANIAYGLRGAAWTRQAKKERVEELLHMVRLDGYATAMPHHLSGGQQQRVALARALARKPALLLLDEPLSALDAQVREALGQELLAVQRATNVTTIMVTHDQQEALALADRIVLMQGGAVEQCGTPEELYRQPASLFVAQFVGHMNIFTLPSTESTEHARPVGIRYEEVEVREVNERVLSSPNTFVAKVERRTLLGASYRLTLLLSDFSTRIFADVSCVTGSDLYSVGSLVAVTFPEHHLRTWDTE